MKRNRMKREYVIMIMLLAVLVACSAPVAAGCCDCDDIGDICNPGVSTCYSGTVAYGTVHVEHADPPLPDPMAGWHNMTFNVPDGDIKWARVYWHIWGGNPQSGGWTNATFTNANSVSSQCGIDIPPIDNNTCCNQTECCGWYMGGFGTHWVYWNVTDDITTGENKLCVDNTDWWDGRVMHMQLVVVLENMPDFPFPTTNYWINQGYISLGDGTLDPLTYTTWFNGATANNARDGTLWHLALANHEMNISFNGNHVASYPWQNDYYGKKAELIPSGFVDGDGSESMTWDALGDDPHPVEAIFVDNDYHFKPDLVVEDKKIEHMNGSCYCQTPTAFVVCHIYDVDVLVKNRGGVDSGAFNVCLYDDGLRVDTERVSSLKPGECKWVRLQWHPTTAGVHTLRAMADNDYEVTELSETNNNKTQNDDVLLNNSGLADLYPELRVLPAWQSNGTELVIKMFNDGTTDAGSVGIPFTVSATMPPSTWTTSSQTHVCAKAYREITYTTSDIVNCSDYTATVVLDSTGVVPETNEVNNTAAKTFHAVDVRLKVTHHDGNRSAYNGPLTDNHAMSMIDVSRVIPNCATAYDFLNSEVDITSGTLALPPNIAGINNTANRGASTWYLTQNSADMETCPLGKGIYWYGFVNGIPVTPMPDKMDYVFGKPGDVLHLDILKYVNSGNTSANFKPRPIMDFPEPFRHGYDGVVWATTIVEPTNGNYAAEAAAIQATLVSEGVAVNMRTDATVTAAEKQNNHLILLGTPVENDLIAEINAKHTEIGMPMYFDISEPDAIRLYDDMLYNDDDPLVPDCCSEKNSSYHSVIMACDNPFNNAAPWTDTWRDDDQSVWIVSGVTECYAKDAANTLASGNLGDMRFWNKSRSPGGCGDIDGNCIVDWFDYITLKCAVGGVSGWGIKTSNWASDVDNCNCRVDWFDYITLKCAVGGVSGWTVNCCDDCECGI